MAEFAQRGNLSFSAQKCIYIGQGTTPDMNGSRFSARPSANYLGTIINLDGIHRTWQKTQIAKCYPLINNLSSKTPLNLLPLHRRATIYKAFIRSGYEYLIQLGSLLGNNQLALRNIHRYALEQILLLPANCNSSLLWLLLRIEAPMTRTTRLQWLWYKKLETNPITKNLLTKEPLHSELSKPELLKLNEEIISLLRNDRSLQKISIKSLSLRHTTVSAWKNLERTAPVTFTLLRKANLTATLKKLNQMPPITQANFFITHLHVHRNNLLRDIVRENENLTPSP
jgi:hypothetical protein